MNLRNNHLILTTVDYEPKVNCVIELTIYTFHNLNIVLFSNKIALKTPLVAQTVVFYIRSHYVCIVHQRNNLNNIQGTKCAEKCLSLF